MQEKINLFTEKGKVLFIQHIPAFVSPKEEMDYYIVYWLDEANIKLHNAADFKYTVIIYSAADLLKLQEWIQQFADDKGLEFKYSVVQMLLIKLLVSGRTIKEAKYDLHKQGSNLDNQLCRMKLKAGNEDMTTKDLIIIFTPTIN